MPNASVRVDEGFYQRINRYAQLKGVSVAEIFRQGAEQLMDSEQPCKHTVSDDEEHCQNKVILVLEQQLQTKDETFTKQLEVKDEQIRELTHLLSQEQHIAAMAQKTLTATNEHLDQTRLALEAATKKRRWWEKLIGKKQVG